MTYVHTCWFSTTETRVQFYCMYIILYVYLLVTTWYFLHFRLSNQLPTLFTCLMFKVMIFGLSVYWLERRVVYWATTQHTSRVQGSDHSHSHNSQCIQKLTNGIFLHQWSCVLHCVHYLGSENEVLGRFCVLRGGSHNQIKHSPLVDWIHSLQQSPNLSSLPHHYSMVFHWKEHTSLIHCMLMLGRNTVIAHLQYLIEVRGRYY